MAERFQGSPRTSPADLRLPLSLSFSVDEDYDRQLTSFDNFRTGRSLESHDTRLDERDEGVGGQDEEEWEWESSPNMGAVDAALTLRPLPPEDDAQPIHVNVVCPLCMHASPMFC